MVSSEQCVVCLRVGVQVVGDSTVAHDELSSVQRVTHPRLAFGQRGYLFWLYACRADFPPSLTLPRLPVAPGLLRN